MPNTRPSTARSRRVSPVLAALAALAVLSACSSAPAPTGLTTGPQGAGGQAPGQAAGQGAPPSSGGTAAPGGTGGTGGPAGPAAGGTGSSGGAAAGGSAGGSGGGSTSGSAAGGSTGGGSTGGSAGGGASGGPTAGGSHLFTPAEDHIGLTKNSLTMCAHAALTYGKAFNTQDSDFNVFWTALNKEHNGIHGRQVTVTYENDNYDPATAVTAANTCKAKGIFMLLGGIGFDQIPAVRNWAETNHQLYLYHTATVNGSAGLKYSYTTLPTVERTGEAFGQLAQAKYADKRIGIIERDSSNWSPGTDAFKAYAKKHNINIVKDDKVATNAGSYANQILDMENAKADVVFVWLNALESTELIKQAKAQQYNPHYLLFPFNLTSQTLGSDALNPPMDGVAMYPSFSKGDYTGTFAPYQDDVKEFEREYATYDSGADLSGVGGDLLFLNWTAQRALAVLLDQCGADCGRNKFIDVLQHYNGVPSTSNCRIDFTKGDGHHGGQLLNFMQTYNSPSGKVNWHETQSCVPAP